MGKLEKIITIVLSLFCVTGLVLLYLYSTRPKSEDKFYTLEENISYVNDINRTACFNVYCNNKDSLIRFTNRNSYELILDSFSFALEDVEIKQYKEGKYYQLKIYVKIPNISSRISSQSCKLKIRNQKYEVLLSFGSISILRANSNLLSIRKLYGSFSYIDNKKMLVGINIEFTYEYNNLSELKIGDYIYGDLNNMKENTLYDNLINIKQIIPSYDIEYKISNNNYELSSKRLFIPLTYKLINLTKSGYITLNLDNNEYYIDTFDFMINDFSPMEYESLLKEAEYL